MNKQIKEIEQLTGKKITTYVPKVIMPCGCHVRSEPLWSDEIIFCTKHEASPLMYEALKNMPIPETITVDGKDYQAIPHELMANWWMNKRKPVLAKTEGGK